ncbi:hypothetical protein SAY86_024461 [Trapa natans]|uniref:non-specific serine/threonine protein kinase n=1 Tax=Trapa natans TaxID=22666 RepID=A0AAN7RI16_TRANT|nr:hypothetical protein SAY86_024461 [Trapa natans]
MASFPLKSSSPSLVIRWCLFLLFLFRVSSYSIFSAVLADDYDQYTLIELKNSLTDPSGLLSSWNSSSSHCSAWFGISCDSNNRVTSLNVTGDGAEGKHKPFLCADSAQFPLYAYGFRRNCAGSEGRLMGKLLPLVAKLTELRVLALSFNGLYGQLPAEIWGMEKLEVLDLEGNSFSGFLPDQFTGLKRLRTLNLGFNNFSGEVPAIFSGLTGVEIFNLAGNSLIGHLPEFIGQFKSVYLAFNQFTGPVPDIIGKSCSKLEHLDLSGNLLGGQIPGSIGSCVELRSLLLYSNMLEEVIPPELGQLKKLEVMDLSRNTLSGALPVELGNCTSLSVLVLSNLFDPLAGVNAIEGDLLLKPIGSVNAEYNYFQGELPMEITKLPKLKILWAPRTNLLGIFPKDWGVCNYLEMVNLAHNFFTGEIPRCLGNCKRLQFFDLSSNKLNGELPEEIQVPCMTMIDVSGNSLTGPIPEFHKSSCLSIKSSESLVHAYLSLLAYNSKVSFPFQILGGDEISFPVVHNFGQNLINGSLGSMPLSPKIMGMRTVYTFLVGENNLSGLFPENVLENCEGLDAVVIDISYNKISGQVPRNLGTACESLILLDASQNRFSGLIPSIIGNIVALNLSWNMLEGPIPKNFGQIKGLKYLSLAGNRLNDSIPSSLGQLESLMVLDLSLNTLSGEIPNELLNLKNLTVLLLNNNKLSGLLPYGLTSITSLRSFNVSFNNLSGPLPLNNNLTNCDNVLGNNFTRPCTTYSVQKSGSLTNYTPTPTTTTAGSKARTFTAIEIASIASASAIVSVLIALIILFIYTRKWKPKRGLTCIRKEVRVFEDIGVPLTFESVVRATSGFNTSNCIGSGGFGATYKAEIAPGVFLAIKRLSVGRFQGAQQFHAEVRTLGRLRHANLVTLIGYHASETEMFLIYNYLPGGNLEKFIQERSTRGVDWRTLHKIAFHIAKALTYLHDTCVPRVLHRDVKPSNILLDEDCNAYLSDFGLARLLGTSETHATTGVAGTFGYVAPEYAMTCRVSDKADVYSYGVVLLELLSDKKALDPSFSSYGDGFNIVAWACLLLRQGRAKEFFTAGLWDVGPHDDMIEVLHLAVVCTVDSLSTRPTMKQVAHRLKKLHPPMH